MTRTVLVATRNEVHLVAETLHVGELLPAAVLVHEDEVVRIATRVVHRRKHAAAHAMIVEARGIWQARCDGAHLERRCDARTRRREGLRRPGAHDRRLIRRHLLDHVDGRLVRRDELAVARPQLKEVGSGLREGSLCRSARHIRECRPAGSGDLRPALRQPRTRPAVVSDDSRQIRSLRQQHCLARACSHSWRLVLRATVDRTGATDRPICVSRGVVPGEHVMVIEPISDEVHRRVKRRLCDRTGGNRDCHRRKHGRSAPRPLLP